MTQNVLVDRSVLLIEDEYFQARELKSWLERAGARVIGPTGSLDDVPKLLSEDRVDGAVVDVNLGSGPNFAAARLLETEGVPFVLLTGYDRSIVPTEFDAVSWLLKPTTEAALIAAVADLTAA